MRRPAFHVSVETKRCCFVFSSVLNFRILAIILTCVCSFFFRVVSALFSALLLDDTLFFIHFWFFSWSFCCCYFVRFYSVLLWFSSVLFLCTCEFVEWMPVQNASKYAPQPIYFNVIGVKYEFLFVFMIKLKLLLQLNIKKEIVALQDYRGIFKTNNLWKLTFEWLIKLINNKWISWSH